jgi:hypothetical protein
MKILKIKKLEDVMYNSNNITNEIKKNEAIIIRNAFNKEKVLFVLKKINQQIKKIKKIDIEKHVKRGDVVVYDGKSYHGVEDIDPNLPFSSNDLSGRVVALATVYK